MRKIKEKLKTCSTKKKETISEYKIVTDINLCITVSLFPPVFSETAPEVERNKKNSGKVQKFTDIFSKKYIQSLIIR